MKNKNAVPRVPSFSLREEDRCALAAAVRNGVTNVKLEALDVALGEGSLDVETQALNLGVTTIDLMETPALWTHGKQVSQTDLARLGRRVRSLSPGLPVRLAKPIGSAASKGAKGTLIGLMTAGTGECTVLGIFEPARITGEPYYAFVPMNRETVVFRRSAAK